MPLSPVNVGGNAGMQQLYNMFRINPNAFPGTNPGAFADEANNEIAATTAQHNMLSPEKRGEQELLDTADRRAEVGIRSGLAEADAVRQARNMGFNSSNPLKEEAEYQAQQKLRQVMLPEQMKLQASLVDKENQREFSAGQNKLNRDAMTQRTGMAQAGQDRRQTDRAAEVAAKSVKLGHNPLRSFLSPLGIMDSNEKVRDTEANRMRENVRSSASNGPANTVHMIAPNGEEADVPEAMVQDYLAKGAQVVN